MLRVMTRNGLGLWALVASVTVACLGCQGKKGQDLTVAQLTSVVAANQEQLRPCYQTALDKEPDTAEFRLQATLHVAKSGEVADVEVERGRLAGLAPCVEKVVRGWKFPSAKADTRAALPLIFRPTVESMHEAPRNPFADEEQK